MSLTLNATETITGVGGSATSITYTIFGDEIAGSPPADTFKVLAQGQLPSAVGTLYTVPASTQAIVKAIHLVNGTAGTVTARLNVNGTAAANQILPPISILAGGFAVYADDGWKVYNDQGQLLGVGATGDPGAAGAAGAGYGGTSTTSLAIGTGSKTFTTQAGLAYLAGARIRATSDAAPTVDYMEGVVTSYSGTTLIVTMDLAPGSGTHTDWSLNIAGDQGTAGGGMTNPMTTAGDVIYGGVAGAPTRLGIGGANSLLHGGASAPAYSAVLPADLDVSADNTTADATTGHHGLLPKLGGGTTNFLRADGTWNAPAGGGGSGFDLDSYSLDATYGDDFTAASLNTTLWTRRNFAAGAESYQVGKVGTYIRIAMTGRVAGDGYLQTAPGGDWTFAMAHINRLHGEHTWGVCVLDSAGTGIGTALADTGGGVWTFAALGITTYTTYSGVAQVTGSSQSLNPLYIRHNKIWQYLRKSGTDYFAAFSLDGETWSPETPAFSSAITVDRVGMIAHPQAALTTTAQVDVDWFNKIA